MAIDVKFISSSERLNVDGKKNIYLNKLYFYGVKNEYESCQLIVNSCADIENINLISADITNDNGVISKDCFDVYLENYSLVKEGSPFSIAYDSGLYADALIPQSACNFKVNSPNGIKTFFVTLKIPKDCKAGSYNGNFFLIADHLKVEIPVEIEVADYILSDKRTMPTCFGIFADYLDPNYPVDDELLEICFKEHLKYRLNPFFHFSVYPSSERIVALLDKFFDDQRFTCFGLPDLFGAKSIEHRIDVFKDTLLLLAQKSTKERNLLSKIFVYYFDEPEGNRIVDKVEASFAYFNATLQKVLDEINADKKGIYNNFKEIENYSQYVLKVKILGTSTLGVNSGIIQENTDIWCPPYADFTDDKFVDSAKAVCDNLNSQLWWYGCSGPLYPFPTYHIADRLNTSRVVSWMQYGYGVSGNLYFRTYGIWKDEIDKVDNLKGECDASLKPFGDGFLFYYGSICNQKTPFPSIRLMSIRDGIEEYELLCDLERKYKEYAKEFDCSFNARLAVKTICDKLYDNVYMKNDEKLFQLVRRELIEKLSNHFAIPYAVGCIKNKVNKGIVTFYTVKNAYLFINDVQLKQTTNGVYVYPFDLSAGVITLKVSVCSNGVTEDHYERISDYIDYFDKVACDKLKDAFFVKNANSTIEVCYSPVRKGVLSKGVGINLKYNSDENPEIYFDLNLIDNNLLKNANKIAFTVTNLESRSLTIFEKLCGDEKEVYLEANELFANRENILNVEIDFLKPKIDFVPKFIKIILRNTYPEDTKKDMKIIIDNFKISYNT